MSRVVLAFDTTTEACSVALFDGANSHSHRFLNTREHAVKVLPMIEELLSSNGLARTSIDGIAFARGPGSFTGCRISTTVAQSLGFALDRPLVPVSTLETLAEGAHRERGVREVAVAIDARMQQVYWGCFVRDGLSWSLHGEESVLGPSDVTAPDSRRWVGAGSGWAAYGEALVAACPNIRRHFGRQLPDALDVLNLALPRLARGEAVDAEQVEPVYLRDKVALTTAERSTRVP